MLTDIFLPENLYLPVLVFLAAFLFAVFSFPIFIKLLERNQIIDQQAKHKIHQRRTPSIGGVPIFVAVLLALLLFTPQQGLSDLKYLIAAIFILFFVGLRDDLTPLNAYLKLGTQITPALIVYFFFDVSLNSFYTLSPLGPFPSTLALLISIFTIIIITNSFNLIDGLDGLAGLLGLISLLSFSIYYLYVGNENFLLVLIAICGATAAFLIYNWSPAKIFMGDTGALFIGFIMACSCILFINHNSSAEVPTFRASIGTAMAFIAVPLFDTFRIIVYRIKRGQSPFQADQNHLHHFLLRLGLGHGKVAVILGALQLFIILLAFAAKNQSDLFLFGLLAIVLFSFNFLISLLIRRKSQAKKTGI
ncbi:MAG: undecaprenyl/decaprenyl-phosphate alpha-N-acetylglucosaminyl 1-phosphate transferase [Cyclobacteriaceae bacterium]|nr:undecaprenyl/decaprenyl-phosphate alpha-N-acetylglucosaminyl 1-phosphate transferase [Cyclobacteriaceae bacterium]